MTETVRILIVEDLATDAELAEREIRKVLPGSRFRRVETPQEFLDSIESFNPDVIVSDYMLPQFNGMEALNLAKKRMSDTPFIILTGSINEDTAVECMKAGAWDYVIKEHIKRIGGAVISALEQKKLREERRSSEEALRESEKKYRIVVENSSDAICITWNSKINFVNDRQLTSITGYSREELESKPFHSIIHPEDLGDVLDRHARRIAGEDIPSVNNFRIITKSGETRWVEANTILFEWEKKEAELAFIKDITVSKKAEIEINNTLAKLRKALEGTVMTLAIASEVRDPYTAGHQKRVADLAGKIAVEMNLPDNDIDGIRMAGLIHDLGKIGNPADILSKPGRLNQIEYNLIKTHCNIGYEILKKVDFEWPVADIVIQHHERIDGSGYPRGLKGSEILIEARIMAVADVVEAISSHRPYRAALGMDAALEEIRKNRGVLYDETAVDACLRVIEKGFKFA